MFVSFLHFLMTEPLNSSFVSYTVGILVVCTCQGASIKDIQFPDVLAFIVRYFFEKFRFDVVFVTQRTS